MSAPSQPAPTNPTLNGAATVPQLVAEPEISPEFAAQIEVEVQRQRTLLCARIDHTFAWLMLAQWVFACGIAVWISPLTWAGDTSRIHPHLAFAFLYGGILTLGPVLLTRLAPGQRSTRLTIATSQMLMSALLIHLSGGRIETHFHIFGSLAFLACYLDWQVLVTASLVVLVDHVIRGYYFPFSAFGSYDVQPWRALEHAGWVIFCDVFLLIAGQARLRGLRESSTRFIERSRLLHRAHYDPLTNLPNRNFLSEKIAELILACARYAPTSTTPSSACPDNTASSPAFSCLYIDLDRFKIINDTLGHASGDAVLCLVARRMQESLGPDAFIARVGGDEFIALIPDQHLAAHAAHDHPDIDLAASTLLRTLSQPFDLVEQGPAGENLTIGASIGISHYPAHGRDEAELLLSSDRAMYTVKRSGRNDFLTYNPELDPESKQRHQAENDLQQALRDHQLEPFFQPIYRAATGHPSSGSAQLAGLELLLRWNHPARGYISPGSFIPLAEQTGLIFQLAAFVLKEAAICATDWRSRHLLSGRIAVNVSSLELAREDFAQTVIQTLHDHQTSPDAIELEVTETTLVNDFELAERQLQTLREHGIHISIDDFGTGYSSLSRLRQLTLDSLKIDQSFIQAAETSLADRTVIEHIIAMAHTLGMQVIAEGVETEGQLQILRDLDCDLIQGFYLGRPGSKAATEQLLLQLQAAKDDRALPADPTSAGPIPPGPIPPDPIPLGPNQTGPHQTDPNQTDPHPPGPNPPGPKLARSTLGHSRFGRSTPRLTLPCLRSTQILFGPD